MITELIIFLVIIKYYLMFSWIKKKHLILIIYEL